MALRRVAFALSIGLVLIGLPGLPSFLSAQTPIITVRLSNPQISCATLEYCLDVEFKSNLTEQEIFGMNIRFFYDDDVLELVDFRDFQGGYGPVAPNPPIIATSASAGPALFNFIGAAEFVNGAMQLINSNAPPIFLDTTEWTKIFQICFLVDDPEANLDTFCPAVIWDLEQDPENGGFLSGDDGIVITVDDPDPDNESLPTTENVVQFNWMYTGNGTPPYGEPVDSTCSNINCTLPLTLLYFKGKATEKGNQLEWKTSTEINAAGFELQRKLDGMSWESIGFINSEGISGSIQAYSFLDQYPGWGTDYYRIQQVDLDGKFAYSTIISINDQTEPGIWNAQIYPNPVKEGHFFIYLHQAPKDNGIIRMLDSTGHLIRESSIDEASFKMEVNGLIPGIYFVIISMGGENTCERILIY
jgi:hypothetical protein